MPPLLRALRPHQWTKNLLVFAAPVFALRLGDGTAMARAALAFVLFCAVSSAFYLVNDLRDRESDRLHPDKSRRPIAAGEVGTGAAVAAALVLGCGGLAAAALFGTRGLAGVLVAYALLQLGYNAGLRHVPVLDALLVASGFVLRAVAGAAAVPVVISSWLLVCTVFFALFVSFAKRRHELELLAGSGAKHRSSLDGYDAALLDQMIAVATACSLMAYALYTADAEVARRLGTPLLPITLPFVVYCFLRFLYLLRNRPDMGDPSRALLNDRSLAAGVLAWGGAVLALLYLR